MAGLKNDICTSGGTSSSLLGGISEVALDAIIGRLARASDVATTHAELKSAVESTAAGASKIIRVDNDISWPPQTLPGGNVNPDYAASYTITVPAGANVTIFGGGGVFRRQKVKLSGLGDSTELVQVCACAGKGGGGVGDAGGRGQAGASECGLSDRSLRTGQDTAILSFTDSPPSTRLTHPYLLTPSTQHTTKVLLCL